MNYSEIQQDVENLISPYLSVKLHPQQDPKTYPGILVVIEGADGAGKTIMAKKMVEEFRSSDLPAEYVRTPGGTEVGEKIRNILLDNDNFIHPITEAFLFQAQLAQCITQVIKPQLKAGKLVVCDRLIFSTLAYQGVGRGADLEWLFKMQLVSLQGVWPDFGFFLFNKPKESKEDRMENTSEEFKLKVRAFYSCIAKNYDLKKYFHSITVSEILEATLDDMVGIVLRNYMPLLDPLIMKNKEEKKDNENTTTP